jgi:beta-fructofuranosidase
VTPADPAFPRLHGRPARGWVNDPNGCCRADGRYHVFFQYNPDAPVHHGIKWGHVSSADLVHWREDGIALVNRPGELDSYGCWSGCVVDDDGVPTAVYSAVADDSHRAEVVLARGDPRLRSWRQGRTSVARPPDDAAVSHVRDPFVFRAGGRRYAIQGAGHTGGEPRILVYGCDDLTSWTELGTLLSGADPVAAAVASANIWECPNLVRFGDRWVLIVSLWGHNGGGFPLGGVRYLVGDLSLGAHGPRFAPSAGGELDRGPCFYAPQVAQVDGRILLWAWSWERGRSPADIAAAGWAGALTFCRELSLDGETLLSRPAAELAGLRRERLELVAGDPFDAAAFEAELPADAGRVSLRLADAAGERPVTIGAGERLAAIGAGEALVADRAGEALVADVDPAPSGARVLVDGSMVEIFGGGPTAYTTRAYPTATSRWVLRWAGEAPVRAWRLGD